MEKFKTRFTSIQKGGWNQIPNYLKWSDLGQGRHKLARVDAGDKLGGLSPCFFKVWGVSSISVVRWLKRILRVHFLNMKRTKHEKTEQEMTFHFRHLDLPPPSPNAPISIKQPQVLRLAKAVLHNSSKAVNPGSVVQPFKHRKVGRILVSHQLYTLSVIALKILIKCFAQNWIISSNMDELRFLIKCGLYTADLRCKFNQISWWLPTVPRPTMSSLVLYWAQKSGLAAVSSRRMFRLAICDNCCIYMFASVWIYRYVYYI